MKCLWLILLASFSLIFFAGCQSGTENNSSTNATKTFRDNELLLSANTDYARFDSTITISMEGLPFYNGKGRIVLQVTANGKSAQVFSPVQDIIGSNQHSNASEYRTSFESRLPFSTQWEIRLLNPPGSYTFEGYAYMDSIWVDGSLIAIDSPEARSIVPFGNRFHNLATAPQQLYLPFR